MEPISAPLPRNGLFAIVESDNSDSVFGAQPAEPEGRRALLIRALL